MFSVPFLIAFRYFLPDFIFCLASSLPPELSVLLRAAHSISLSLSLAFSPSVTFPPPMLLVSSVLLSVSSSSSLSPPPPSVHMEAPRAKDSNRLSSFISGYKITHAHRAEKYITLECDFRAKYNQKYSQIFLIKNHIISHAMPI